MNRIVLENEESTSLIRGVNFGVLEPGVESVKTLYLLNTGVVGDRTLDVSIRSQPAASLPASPTPQTADSAGLHDVNETLQTLVVPTTQAIKITSNVTYQRSLQPHPGLADLKTYGNDFWEDTVSGEAIITSIFRCAASCGLKLEGIQFENQVRFMTSVLTRKCDGLLQDHATAKSIDCSVDGIEAEDIADGIWSPSSINMMLNGPPQTGLPEMSSPQAVV